MFLYLCNSFINSLEFAICDKNKNNKNNTRKATLSPKQILYNSLLRAFYKKDTGTFIFAPLRGSLTVEASLIVPFFLFAMIAVLQYASVMGTAVRLGTALTETGKEMACAAYLSVYGGEASAVTDITAGAMSELYAQGKIKKQAGDTSDVKSVNLLYSSFLKENDMIDLVLTYQMKSFLQMIPLPAPFFIQRARVRAWTGRIPQDGSGDHADSMDKEIVYITEYGTVYHKDPECSYLKLSIQPVNMEQVSGLRNNSGEIYRKCEFCKPQQNTGTVYITQDGNRYHSSVTCSGLKRTMHEATMEEVEGRRACSKCGH